MNRIGGVEQFLADAIDGAGDLIGESGDDKGDQHAAADAAGDPFAALRHASARRQHDANDQSGFKHFPEDDDSNG